jgi:hypothetical protein
MTTQVPVNARERWYRPPVMWLGAAILLCSIAGCIALIFVASA